MPRGIKKIVKGVKKVAVVEEKVIEKNNEVVKVPNKELVATIIRENVYRIFDQEPRGSIQGDALADLVEKIINA